MFNSKIVKSFLISSTLALFIFTGCGNDLNRNEYNGEYGSITVVGDRSVETDAIKSAIVTVSGYDSNGKSFSKNSGVVAVNGGKATGIKVDNIPVSTNAVVEVQAYGDTTASSSAKIDGIKISAVSDVTSAGTTVSVGWGTSVKGKVYKSLLDKNVNTSTASLSKVDSVISSLVSNNVHSALVDADSIASDYSSPKSYSNYVLKTATITVNASDVSGYSVQISDPVSTVPVINNDGSYTYEVAPGTWNVYAINGSEVEDCAEVTVGSDSTGTVTVEKGADTTGSIVVHIAKSLFNWDQVYCYAWGGSVKSAAWPGDKMTLNGDTWDYTIACTSTKLIFNNNGSQTGDLSLTDAGEYDFKGSTSSSGSSDFTKRSSSGSGKAKITVGEISGPVLAKVTVPSSAYIGGTFAIDVESNAALDSSNVTINGKSVTLTAGTNTFNVSDFTSSATTLTVTGTVTNNAGSTTVSGSISVVEKPANTLVTNWNELRIYQVMVSSFQNGDPTIGYTCAYGPSDALTGGDLQGIINALDYIKELGCNALWMTPIFNSDGSGELDSTGYFAKDYFNIDPKFGTMEKFDELVKNCHEKGIAVILDGVFGHNKGEVWASPTRKGINNPGITPSTSNPVDYAGNENSLKYYSDVARYWITEHKIDGWRFDQCYQLGFGENATGSDNCKTGGHNYWYDIRKVIEEAAASNGKKGQNWGTLGYMVGEHWRGDATLIQKGSVTPGNSKGYGLQGCFDFPAYYQLVQNFAQEHGGKSSGNITTGLSYLYKTYSEKGYECKEDDGTYEPYYPNCMLSNHDLFRIGDLIQEKYSDGYDSDNYAKRNMVVLAAQGAYSGPITIYYGDEIGDHSEDKSGWYSDNVARSSGKISGFNSREQKIHDFEQKVLTARSEHEALWNGTNTQITGESDFYVAKKVGGGETIYIAFNYNASSSKTFSASGTDLLTGTTYSGTVTVPALSAVYILAK